MALLPGSQCTALCNYLLRNEVLAFLFLYKKKKKKQLCLIFCLLMLSYVYKIIQKKNRLVVSSRNF